MRAFDVTLLVAGSLSLALSIYCQREPQRYPIDQWHQDTRDNRTWSEREIDAIYWTEQYRHAAVWAKREQAEREYATAKQRMEAASTDLTDAERRAAWRLLWKNK